MEKDKPRQSNAVFITGLTFLTISLSLFAFSIYILPYLVFKWNYDVPEFISNWQYWLQEKYNYREGAAAALIFLFFFVLSCISAGVSYLFSNYVEGVEQEKPVSSTDPAEIKREVKDTASLLFKIIGIAILILIGLYLIQWLIYIPPTE